MVSFTDESISDKKYIVSIQAMIVPTIDFLKTYILILPLKYLIHFLFS